MIRSPNSSSASVAMAKSTVPSAAISAICMGEPWCMCKDTSGYCLMKLLITGGKA
ncbi:hypothetical protein D3C75_1262170 [compost metagenome]